VVDVGGYHHSTSIVIEKVAHAEGMEKYGIRWGVLESALEVYRKDVKNMKPPSAVKIEACPIF